MPIGLGLASSHAPTIVAPLDQWVPIYERFAGRVPQPPSAALETEAVRQEQFERIGKAFAALRERINAYRPELLIIVGGDQSEMFDASNVPNLMLYVGEEAWADVPRAYTPESGTERLQLRVDVDTSRWLLDKLVREEDFDIAISARQEHLGARGRGLPHAFFRPVPLLIADQPQIPCVLLYENTYDPPSLTAKRCYDLGATIARLFRDDGRRIAIYGSGGLSHDPGGPRGGWIDTPLDTWFLSRLADGDGQATTAMYRFDSLTMRGGTGEMRAWITVGGAMEAMGTRATIVDYVPCHHGVTGLGWAYWEHSQAAAA